MKNNLRQKNNQKGFALLYAVLVAVLVVAVGASVVSLAIKQVVLTGTARESEYAFYAANTGMECARYWDTQSFGGKRAFPSSDETEADLSDYDAMFCGNDSTDLANKVKSKPININALNDAGTPSARLYTMPYKWEAGDHRFSFELDNNIVGSTKTCVEVRVQSEDKSDPVDGDYVLVTITSQGLNTCDINSPRAVQRGLVLQYRR